MLELADQLAQGIAGLGPKLVGVDHLPRGAAQDELVGVRVLQGLPVEAQAERAKAARTAMNPNPLYMGKNIRRLRRAPILSARIG